MEAFKKYAWEAAVGFVFCLAALQIWHHQALIVIPMALALAWYMALSLGNSAGSIWFGNAAFLTADLLLDRVPDRRESPYVFLAQTIGALLAVPFSAFLLRCAGITEVDTVHPDAFCAFFAEFLGAFTLTLAYQRAPGNAYAVQGATFAVLLYTLADLSAGAYNPALALSYAFSGRITWGDFPFYIGAELLGGAASVSLQIGLRND